MDQSRNKSVVTPGKRARTSKKPKAITNKEVNEPENLPANSENVMRTPQTKRTISRSTSSPSVLDLDDSPRVGWNEGLDGSSTSCVTVNSPTLLSRCSSRKTRRCPDIFIKNFPGKNDKNFIEDDKGIQGCNEFWKDTNAAFQKDDSGKFDEFVDESVLVARTQSVESEFFDLSETTNKNNEHQQLPKNTSSSSVKRMKQDNSSTNQKVSSLANFTSKPVNKKPHVPSSSNLGFQSKPIRSITIQPNIFDTNNNSNNNNNTRNRGNKLPIALTDKARNQYKNIAHSTKIYNDDDDDDDGIFNQLDFSKIDAIQSQYQPAISVPEKPTKIPVPIHKYTEAEIEKRREEAKRKLSLRKHKTM